MAELQTNFNVAPFYDDYNENYSHFFLLFIYKILKDTNYQKDIILTLLIKKNLK